MKLSQSLRPLNLAKIFMLAFFATIVGVFVTYFDQSEKWTLNRFLFVGFTSFLVALLVQFVLDKEMVKNNNAPKRFDLKTILSHTFYLICMLPSYLNENYFMLSMMTLGFITILFLKEKTYRLRFKIYKNIEVIKALEMPTCFKSGNCVIIRFLTPSENFIRNYVPGSSRN